MSNDTHTFCWGIDSEDRFVIRVDMNNGSKYVATLGAATAKALMVALLLWIKLEEGASDE
jgi:hypothetical protein